MKTILYNNRNLLYIISILSIAFFQCKSKISKTENPKPRMEQQTDSLKNVLDKKRVEKLNKE